MSWQQQWDVILVGQVIKGKTGIRQSDCVSDNLKSPTFFY